MKLLSVLLSVAGVSGLVLVCPALGALKDTAPLSEKEMGRQGETTQVVNSSPSHSSIDLLAQGVTRVTGVEITQTENGLELILETVAGSEQLVPLIVPEGNNLVIDILDATLALPLTVRLNRRSTVGKKRLKSLCSKVLDKKESINYGTNTVRTNRRSPLNYLLVNTNEDCVNHR